MMDHGPGWTAIELDEVERVPWQASELTWRPLRHALDTRIIGIAAFTAEHAEQQVIEDHVEAQDGRGHDEIYIVLRGGARFTLDDRELDAPAGTLIHVAAAVRRSAVATSPGTAVLALGGPPTFTPSASEWIERARPYVRSDPGRARQIIDELGRELPESPGVDIAEALLLLGRGDLRAASATLAALLDREPDLREALASDPDLGPLLKGPA